MTLSEDYTIKNVTLKSPPVELSSVKVPVYAVVYYDEAQEKFYHCYYNKKRYVFNLNEIDKKELTSKIAAAI